MAVVRAECAKTMPLDYKGHVTYWYVGANEASPPLRHEYERKFFEAFAKTYSNITMTKVNIGYNDIFKRTRQLATAAADDGSGGGRQLRARVLKVLGLRPLSDAGRARPDPESRHRETCPCAR